MEQVQLTARLAELTDQAEAIRQHPRRYAVAPSALLGPLMQDIEATQRQLSARALTFTRLVR